MIIALVMILPDVFLIKYSEEIMVYSSTKVGHLRYVLKSVFYFLMHLCILNFALNTPL